MSAPISAISSRSPPIRPSRRRPLSTTRRTTRGRRARTAEHSDSESTSSTSPPAADPRNGAVIGARYGTFGRCAISAGSVRAASVRNTNLSRRPGILRRVGRLAREVDNRRGRGTGTGPPPRAPWRPDRPATAAGRGTGTSRSRATAPAPAGSSSTTRREAVAAARRGVVPTQPRHELPASGRASPTTCSPSGSGANRTGRRSLRGGGRRTAATCRSCRAAPAPTSECTRSRSRGRITELGSRAQKRRTLSSLKMPYPANSSSAPSPVSTTFMPFSRTSSDSRKSGAGAVRSNGASQCQTISSNCLADGRRRRRATSWCWVPSRPAIRRCSGVSSNAGIGEAHGERLEGARVDRTDE